MDTAFHGEVRNNNGLASCHILLGQSSFVDILAVEENNARLRVTSEYESMDSFVNEGIQLHGPKVVCLILDLLIFAEQSDVTISEIILPKQNIAQ